MLDIRERTARIAAIARVRRGICWLSERAPKGWESRLYGLQTGKFVFLGTVGPESRSVLLLALKRKSSSKWNDSLITAGKRYHLEAGELVKYGFCLEDKPGPEYWERYLTADMLRDTWDRELRANIEPRRIPYKKAA